MKITPLPQALIANRRKEAIQIITNASTPSLNNLAWVFLREHGASQ